MIGRMMDGYGDRVSWDDIKSALREKLVPPDYHDQQFQNIVMLKQGQQSVREYVEVFKNLVRRCELNEPPIRLLHRFMNGLNYDIANRLMIHHYLTLEEVIRAASWAEFSISCSEVKEKLQQLMGSVQTTPPENHDDQVCLVKYDNDDLFAEVPENGHEEQMNSINVVDSGLDAEVSGVVNEKLELVEIEDKEEIVEMGLVVGPYR